jgi:hypothetical protein
VVPESARVDEMSKPIPQTSKDEAIEKFSYELKRGIESPWIYLAYFKVGLILCMIICLFIMLWGTYDMGMLPLK